jgi:membrane protease YdiL (CAAX protease family)
MEEGLFRGVMIRAFGSRFSMNRANWLQSVLFGLWHLPWTFKAFRLGKLRGAGDIAFSAVSNFVPQLFMGFVWGFMYVRTGSLWAPWISHTLTNSALNILHIKTDEGMDSGIAVRMTAFVIIMLFGLLFVDHAATKLGFPKNNT